MPAIHRRAASFIHLTTLVVMTHSALMVLVELAVFPVLASIITMLLAFVVIVVHPVLVKMQFEEVKLVISTAFSMGFGRSPVG